MKQIITLFVCILFATVAVMAQSNQTPAATSVAVERVQPEAVADQAPVAAKPGCCASQASTAGCAEKGSASATTTATQAPESTATTTEQVAESKKPGCGSAATSAGSGCCSSRGAMRAGGNTPR